MSAGWFVLSTKKGAAPKRGPVGRRDEGEREPYDLWIAQVTKVLPGRKPFSMAR